MRTCSVDGCEREHYGLDLCSKHYKRFKRNGNTSKQRKLYTLEKLSHYSSYVDDCLFWTKGTTTDGYGVIWIDAKPFRAHRISYQLHVGEIPRGMYVLHKCDNPACIKPSHLFLGTHQDNMDDMVKKGRSLYGEKNAGAKLTEAEVIDIREKIGKTKTHAEIAHDYNVSRTAIHKIKVREKWKHI